jgi:tRNA acetyltransferase TAN1
VFTLLSDFNLLATSERGFESGASTELWMTLREIGDEKPIVDRAPVRGLIVAKTTLDPVGAVKRLREELLKNPGYFRSLFRVIPIDRVVPSEPRDIAEVARELGSRIQAGESFRITVEKRRTGLSSRELIEAVAEGIERKVDLENPDWIILIEIVGRLTGVSVVDPDSIFNVQKEKARLPVGS